MRKEKEIQSQFRKLMQNEIQTFPAKVKMVYKEDKLITVTDTNDFDYESVRLSAIISKGDKIVAYPKQDSWVLVSIINNIENELFVSAFSEVEEIEGKIESTSFLINKEGYKIGREEENLKEVFDDLITEFGKLCDELAKVVVSIGVTPNVPIINQIKQEATVTIKKRLNTILT
jgi:hypothetical protein